MSSWWVIENTNTKGKKKRQGQTKELKKTHQKSENHTRYYLDTGISWLQNLEARWSRARSNRWVDAESESVSFLGRLDAYHTLLALGADGVLLLLLP